MISTCGGLTSSVACGATFPGGEGKGVRMRKNGGGIDAGAGVWYNGVETVQADDDR